MTERVRACRTPGCGPGAASQGNRLGYRSLQLFLALTLLSLFAELLSNDKPLLVRYQGHWFVPLVQTLPETTFGGDFPTPTDFLDPFIRAQLAQPGNFALFPPNRYHYTTINYFSRVPDPAPPSRQNWLGTDDRGRDLLARLLYGFRLSVLFALAVTVVCTVAGVVYGAIQGYFAGWTDIAMERFVEIWGAMPTLYLLIIFSAFFAPSVWLLIALISVFGWMGDRRLRARRVPQEPHPGLRARRPGPGPAGPGDHLPAHPAQLPDPGDHPDPVRDGRRHRRAHQPGLPGPGRARRHPEPGRAAGPGQEQPGRLVDLPGHLHGAGGHPGAADPGGRRPARRPGPAQGDRRRRTP